ncbi:hypothetical protein [Streptomyces niveus]|uniref:SMP-30/Gluconolactonase/LRE-like region domain-containing protein n=1 Tax=Streptomyces niveus TaxID=193462 RepID=A0A1U9R0S3_STRNV|nr:hypothetical protein [Streptomyces niveus]AQU70118.1 hypothetical protein BBN63_32025 [Streptomyces niveus]
MPENITVNPDASVTLSLIVDHAGQRPRLIRISASGHRTVLVTGQPGYGIIGNLQGGDGTVYYNVWSESPERAGAWNLPPGGQPRRIAALPADGLPNGLTLAPAGGTLYAADSHEAIV